jgi:hypothetical protein
MPLYPVKRLVKIGGGSFGVLIPRQLLRLLEITPTTPLKLRTDGRGLTIEPMALAEPATPAKPKPRPVAKPRPAPKPKPRPVPALAKGGAS